ncbi:baseplate wedge subunit [Synechococcus phage S-H68]|jgi:hypothetical protein|nr:baseplate wedge subunit [Synechococcus phage S-H68]
MAQKYFRNIPNFEYVDRTKDGQNISDYTEVKNLFKRGKLREDIFQDLTYFTKYKVVGDERPDEVAYRIYGDANLDWIVMLSNNIINFENEWPMSQQSYDKYLLDKYGSYPNMYLDHHYETNEIKDSEDRIIIEKGLIVPSDWSITFYDTGLGQLVTRSSVYPVSNFEYEERIQNDKRNIFLLKDIYVGLVIDDVETVMPYTPGSTQYVSDRIVRGENIRLYE